VTDALVVSRIERVDGTAITLRGDDIDTDRIIPARFLKAVTFDGLEHHLFEDDCREARERGGLHPFDEPARRHARVLIVGANFGCGSSREHAPQAIARRGIQAVIGESFAEIFSGNALMIGLPCVTADAQDLARLRERADASPDEPFFVDLRAGQAGCRALTVPITLPSAARDALLTGAWDATGLLLEDYAAVESVAAGLPYMKGFGS